MKEKKITTLDYIILALLFGEEQSGYRLRKSFEESALGNFGGDSPGTIYPALKRLEKNEFVLKTQGTDSKPVFKILTKGREAFVGWLKTPASEQEVRKQPDLLILKFAFMEDAVDRKFQLDYIQSLSGMFQAYAKELDLYLESNKTNMPATGALALKHGIETYKTSANWCQKTLLLLKDLN